MTRWRYDGHWYANYHPATGKPSDIGVATDQTPLQVGIGVTCESLDDTRPAIVIHLDGGRCDYDAEAFMTFSEAVAIRDALSEAIASGQAALEEAASLVTRLRYADDDFDVHGRGCDRRRSAGELSAAVAFKPLLDSVHAPGPVVVGVQFVN
ncbi:hypothetical protein [Mycobacterium sp. E740]|uniref:hypothetical protein n=1 Tax=Mycobacterium sp. E740 TaxID=1834149 RepID=UPI0007FD387D|nr:hypothetical protein [Mycobacterium sp. E740]OBI72812.1 hypothetical protein A5663_07665 [Mycobacterium sp. E740]